MKILQFLMFYVLMRIDVYIDFITMIDVNDNTSNTKRKKIPMWNWNEMKHMKKKFLNMISELLFSILHHILKYIRGAPNNYFLFYSYHYFQIIIFVIYFNSMCKGKVKKWTAKITFRKWYQWNIKTVSSQ